MKNEAKRCREKVIGLYGANRGDSERVDAWIDSGDTTDYVPPLHVKRIVDLLLAERAQARAEERASGVGFMRACTNAVGSKSRLLESVANDIERGEHVKEAL